MQKRRWIDILLIATACLLLTVCAFLVKPWVTADAIAVIRPDKAAGSVAVNRTSAGCDSCSGGVLSRLSLSPGVAWVKEDKKSGLLIVAYDSRAIKPERIASGLAESGFASSVAGIMGIDQYCRTNSLKSAVSILGNSSCGGHCRKTEEKGEGR